MLTLTSENKTEIDGKLPVNQTYRSAKPMNFEKSSKVKFRCFSYGVWSALYSDIVPI
jgi:hypothetical protein